jgi:hypothetical protein
MGGVMTKPRGFEDMEEPACVATASHEVLKDTVNKIGTKRVAEELKLSTAMIYKWCQPSDGATASGERNPLDRILALCEATHSDHPVKWLCERCNGVFVRNTALEFDGEPAHAHMRGTQRIVKEFSELLGTLSESFSEASGVSPEMAARIRHDWEDVKRAAERFVRACEHGMFNHESIRKSNIAHHDKQG